MVSTKDVLDNHLKSFSKGDLEGILSDYAPEAVMFTPDGPLRGPGEMRPLFQALIAEFGKPGAVFTMKRQSVDGEYGYILWTAETADNVYEIATDTSSCETARSRRNLSRARSHPKAETSSGIDDT